MQVTISEAARLLGISEPTARRRVRSGELPGTQMPTPQGFVWMVELPDDLPIDSSSPGEIAALRELNAHLKAQVEAQQSELEARRREVQELHVLLQQAQTALPEPRDCNAPQILDTRVSEVMMTKRRVTAW
jgi:Helix-turn-helix domain